MWGFDATPFIYLANIDHLALVRQLNTSCVVPERIHSIGSTEAFVYIAHEVNSMGTISTRVPDELEAELEAYLEAETLDRSTAVRKLLSEGLEEWRREQALDQLAAGTVTFSKAAELAGMSGWDFAQLAKERDITWVAEDHLDADLEAL
nr:UPF0175 family protein [Natronomonas marina]